MARVEAAEGDKLPFKLRFKAWWEGYDPEDLARFEGLDEPAEAAAEPAPEPEEMPTERPEEVAVALKSESELPVDPWDRARIDVAQIIWGEGYCGPGGPEHIIAISKLLALTPKLSMAHIGAGLGGPTRTLVEEFGVWMTGYSTSDALVEAGNELSRMAGMAKKAPLVKFDPEHPGEFERNYDRFFAKEFLYTVEAKKQLLINIEKALKHEGLLLLIDYVIKDESVIAKDEYRAWRDGEPAKPYMVTQEELTEMLNEAGFLLRVNEDQSDNYIGLITEAWKGSDEVIARLMKDKEQRHLIDTLLTEAELWNRRVQLLKSGDLKLCRFLGVKRSDKKGMMSDW